MKRKRKLTRRLLEGQLNVGIGSEGADAIPITSFDLKDYYYDLDEERTKIDNDDVTEKGIESTKFTTSKFLSVANEKMNDLFKDLDKMNLDDRTTCLEHLMMITKKHNIETDKDKIAHIPVEEVFEVISSYLPSFPYKSTKKSSPSSLCFLDRYQIKVLREIDIWKSYRTTLLSMTNKGQIWRKMGLEDLIKWINNSIVPVGNISIYVMNEPRISDTGEGFYVDHFYERWVTEMEKTTITKSTTYFIDMLLFWPLHKSHRFYQGIYVRLEIVKLTDEEIETFSTRKLLFRDHIQFLSSEILTTCICKPEILLSGTDNKK